MSNGKGDKDRVTDLKRFKANYDEINWKEKKVKSNRMLQRFIQRLGVERDEFSK